MKPTFLLPPPGVHTVKTACLNIPLGQHTRLSVKAYWDRSLGRYYYFFLQTESSIQYASYLHYFISGHGSPKELQWEYFTIGQGLVISSERGDFLLKLPFEGDSLDISSVQPSNYSVMKENARVQRQEDEKQKAVEREVVSNSALREVLENTESSDFTIICRDGDSVLVHSSILDTFWPFFKQMMPNEWKESTERTLRLDSEKELVQLIILHIYKQPFELNLKNAMGLLLMSKLYMLSELEMKCSETIMREVTDETPMEELFEGWEISRTADNSELQLFFAKKIANRNPRQYAELFRGLDAGIMADLFFDPVDVSSKSK